MPRPKVENTVYPFMPGGSAEDKQYVQRYIKDSAELDDIKQKGYALPKEGGKGKKYWTAVDTPNTRYPEGQTLVRVPRERVPSSKAVHADDVEVHNRKTGKWAPIRGSSLSGTSGAESSTEPLEIMLGSELDPKKMLKQNGYKKGGKVSSASNRADGIAQRGKTKGRIV